MKKTASYMLFILSGAVLYTDCTAIYEDFLETKTVLCKTNIIGITGPSAEPGEEYIEIRYSAADDGNPGYNKTASIMVSPPYIFQNERVYMQYDLYKRVLEWRPPSRDAVGYQQYMRHDYNEGGAEYLRIINHSTDKIVEFFIAGGQDMPDTIEGSNIYGETFSGSYFLPSVKYKKAPVQYLLFPDRKPKYNFSFYKDLYTFDGNQCGDITVTEPWTTDMVNNLYRAEYGRSEKIILFVDNKPERMVDQFPGKIFWSSIQPEETFQGSDKIWLLATNGIMFQDERDTAFQ